MYSRSFLVLWLMNSLPCTLLAKPCEQWFFPEESTTGGFYIEVPASQDSQSSTCSLMFFNNKRYTIRIDIDKYANADPTCYLSHLSVISSPSSNMGVFPRLLYQHCSAPSPPIITTIPLLVLTLVNRNIELSSNGNINTTASTAGLTVSLQGTYHYSKYYNTDHLIHDEACGEQLLSGVSSILLSPPVTEEEGRSRHRVECNWGIQASEGRRILLRLTDLSIGASEYCTTENSLKIYQGLADPTRLPDKKYCGPLSLVSTYDRQILSTNSTLGIRYVKTATSSSSRFKLEWNEIYSVNKDIPFKSMTDTSKELSEELCAHGDHYCDGGKFCRDSSRLICMTIDSFCIPRALMCDDRESCGFLDDSDESGCDFKKQVRVIVGIAAGIIVLVAVICLLCLRRRRLRIQQREQHLAAERQARCNRRRHAWRPGQEMNSTLAALAEEGLGLSAACAGVPEEKRKLSLPAHIYQSVRRNSSLISQHRAHLRAKKKRRKSHQGREYRSPTHRPANPPSVPITSTSPATRISADGTAVLATVSE